MENCYYIYVVGNKENLCNRIQALIFDYFQLKESDCYFIIHLKNDQLFNPNLFNQLKANELIICVLSGSIVCQKFIFQDNINLSQALLIQDNNQEEILSKYLHGKQKVKLYVLLNEMEQDEKFIHFLCSNLRLQNVNQDFQMSFKAYEEINDCKFLINGVCKLTHQTKFNQGLLQELDENSKQLQNFSTSEKDCNNEKVDCKMMRNQRIKQFKTFTQIQQIQTSQNSDRLNAGVQISKETLENCKQDQITCFYENKQQEQTKSQEQLIEKPELSNNQNNLELRSKSLQASSLIKTQKLDIKILLLSVDEVQEFIEIPKKTKFYSEKNQFYEKTISNLIITRSPLFQCGEDDDLVSVFKKRFQRNNYNCILFCLKFERTDTMKRKLNLMLKKFVGVSRDQLGFITVFNLKNQEQQKYFSEIQEIKSLKLYGIINQCETPNQIEENFKTMFIGFVPKKLNLSETEFAEETEDDKKQQKQIELSLIKFEQQATKARIDEIQSGLEKIDKEIEQDQYEVKQLQQKIFELQHRIKTKAQKKNAIASEKQKLEKQQQNLAQKYKSVGF